MKNKIDERKKSDILRQMQVLSQTYTPEWKFDLTNPDAGSVIGLIFADQAATNIQKLNRVIEKYHTEFANMYGVSLRAAKPAESVVTLKVNDSMAAGIPLKKGTQVIGECEDGEEVIFEFLNDIYVTNASLTNILTVSGNRYKVVPLFGEYQKTELQNGQFTQAEPVMAESQEDVTLFSDQGDTIHTQALVIYHPYLFQSEEEIVGLCLTGDKREAVEQLQTDAFTFSYWTEDGMRPFGQVVREGDIFWLGREPEEKEINLVVIEQKQKIQSPIILKEIQILHKHQEDMPDFLWNNKSSLDSSECNMFGQQPALYDECYIGQKFLFDQMNATVTLSFDLSFDEFTIQQTAVHEPDLSIIKKRPAAMALPLRYECWIQEIAIEYFNGKGWRKLPMEHDLSALFAQKSNEGARKLTFRVPQDWEETTQGGYEGKCLRIQVTRADNCYMQDAIFYYPILQNIRMEIQYPGRGMKPEWVKCINGNRIEDITGRLSLAQPVVCFENTVSDGDYVFWGFDRKFMQGPIALFLEMQDRYYFHGLELAYTYSTRNGFKTLKVMDQTSQLEHSGMIMFMPPTDFAPLEVEGISRYWIRLEDTTGYFAREKTYYPVIHRLHVNTVKVQNREVAEEEDYYLDRAAANMHFPLHADHILSVEIWVNEKEQLPMTRMEQMLREMPKQVRAEYNFLGEIEEFYVLWHETENFDIASYKERCYVVDRLKNEVIFGDGVSVPIPQNTRSVAFKAKVTCCSGEIGNVASHAITKFRGAIPAIEEVTNPIDAYGGNSMEDIKEALVRGSNILGARKRLVSERDYIREVSLYSDTIAQVACIAGVTRSGKRDRNVISIVLLMKDYKKGSYSFKTIEEQLRRHLIQRCEMTCSAADIQIVEPIFVKISLHIWLNVSDLKKSLEIKQHWLERIEQYFEPVTDRTREDVRIGRLPKEKQIRLMLSTLEDKAYISHYTIVAAYYDETGMHETEVDQLMDNPFMVCCNGEHQIHISES